MGTSYYLCPSCGKFKRLTYKIPPKERKCSCGKLSYLTKKKPQAVKGSFGI
jgi:hypothetical protein